MSFSKNNFQKKLLRWYKKNKRPLPWRQTCDPYKILVSEIMLQQTQVGTVIPFYENWLKRFPTFSALAKAKESAVLKNWQGLGYYRRAKMLHQNAKVVCRDYDGKLPSHPEELLQLPGIGRYTAGAVASIAFEKRAPVLDGNVIRVLTRLFALHQNVSEKKTLDFLWKTAEEILPLKQIGDFNQAMMELGATRCFPTNPLCETCPVTSFCQAFKLKQPERFPVKPPSIKVTRLTEFAFAIQDHRSRLLVQKQKMGARWAGLWTLPHFPQLNQGLKTLGLQKKAAKKIRVDRHGFTRYQITLHSFHAMLSKKPSLLPAHFEWMSAQKIKKSAFPAVYQKIVDEVLKK